MQPKKIYLAIPYSGKEEESFEIVNKLAGQLMKQGYVVFSPISHTRPIAQCCELPHDWEFWKKQDEPFIEWCDELWVCYPRNWPLSLCEKSVGVNAEIEMAYEKDKEIQFIDEKGKVLENSMESEAYKGYLIQGNLIGSEFYIIKDGFRIATLKTVDKAKRVIDKFI